MLTVSKIGLIIIVLKGTGFKLAFFTETIILYYAHQLCGTSKWKTLQTICNMVDLPVLLFATLMFEPDLQLEKNCLEL